MSSGGAAEERLLDQAGDGCAGMAGQRGQLNMASGRANISVAMELWSWSVESQNSLGWKGLLKVMEFTPLP